MGLARAHPTYRHTHHRRPSTSSFTSFHPPLRSYLLTFDFRRTTSSAVFFILALPPTATDAAALRSACSTLRNHAVRVILITSATATVRLKESASQVMDWRLDILKLPAKQKKSGTKDKVKAKKNRYYDECDPLLSALLAVFA